MPQPLKPLVFQILLALVEGERQPARSGRAETRDGRHGWALVRDVQQRGGFHDVMPGNFYRTLRGMLADGLIEEAQGRERARGRDAGDRRRYFRLTASGTEAVTAEARRLEALVIESRAKRLLTRRG